MLNIPKFVGLNSCSQLMARLFIMLEWSLDPFLVREGDRKLNFIPLKHLFFTYDLHVPPVPFYCSVRFLACGCLFVQCVARGMMDFHMWVLKHVFPLLLSHSHMQP